MVVFRIFGNLLFLATITEAYFQIRSIPQSRRSGGVASSSLFPFPISAYLHQQQYERRQRLRMSTEDFPEKELQQENSSSSSDGSGSSDVTPSSKSDKKQQLPSGGLTRTLLLAVPLFCKFVMVLMIKFLTDLVVFPLLFLYRMARKVKRGLVRIVTSRNQSNNPIDLEGEQINGDTKVN